MGFLFSARKNFYLSISLLLLSTPHIKGEDNDVRLIGAQRSFTGRVEVELGRTWGTICTSGWDIRDANVVCHQLGYESALLVRTNDNDGSDGLVFLSELNCFGSEGRLSDCPGYRIQTNVTNGGSCRTATVSCQIPQYQGCFMSIVSWVSRSIFIEDLTIEKCLTSCRSNSLMYARLGAASICQCGSSVNFGSERSNSACSVPCLGDPHQACGGVHDSDVYSYYSTTLCSSTGTFTASSGSIVSPNFPGFYEPGMNGDWNITFADQRTVLFQFEYVDIYVEDYLDITARPSGDTVRFPSFVDIRQAYRLSGNTFEIKFTASSDNTDTFAGFWLRYSGTIVVPPTRPPSGVETTTQGSGICPDFLGSSEVDVMSRRETDSQSRILLNVNEPFSCRGTVPLVALYSDPGKIFVLSSWLYDSTSNSYQLYDQATVNVPGNSFSSLRTFFSEIAIQSPLSFIEGSILGISYTSGNSVIFSSNSMPTSPLDEDERVYRLWDWPTGALPERLEINSSTNSTRAISIQLKLEATSPTGVETTTSGSGNGLNATIWIWAANICVLTLIFLIAGLCIIFFRKERRVRSEPNPVAITPTTTNNDAMSVSDYYEATDSHRPYDKRHAPDNHSMKDLAYNETTLSDYERRLPLYNYGPSYPHYDDVSINQTHYERRLQPHDNGPNGLDHEEATFTHPSYERRLTPNYERS